MTTLKQRMDSEMSGELNPREYSDPAPITATLGHGCAGWYVEWFQEDEAAPMGFRCAHWYGTHEDCVARMAKPAPTLRPVCGEGAGPYDAATATGMYD